MRQRKKNDSGMWLETTSNRAFFSYDFSLNTWRLAVFHVFPLISVVFIARHMEWRGNKKHRVHLSQKSRNSKRITFPWICDAQNVLEICSYAFRQKYAYILLFFGTCLLYYIQLVINFKNPHKSISQVYTLPLLWPKIGVRNPLDSIQRLKKHWMKEKQKIKMMTKEKWREGRRTWRWIH